MKEGPDDARLTTDDEKNKTIELPDEIFNSNLELNVAPSRN